MTMRPLLYIEFYLFRTQYGLYNICIFCLLICIRYFVYVRMMIALVAEQKMIGFLRLLLFEIKVSIKIEFGSRIHRFGGRMPLFLFIYHIFFNIHTFISHSYNTFTRHGRPTLPCGAEPRTELGPALQQADALPTEPRRTIHKRTISIRFLERETKKTMGACTESTFFIISLKKYSSRGTIPLMET
jgi:hypothetical protein